MEATMVAQRRTAPSGSCRTLCPTCVGNCELRALASSSVHLDTAVQASDVRAAPPDQRSRELSTANDLPTLLSSFTLECGQYVPPGGS